MESDKRDYGMDGSKGGRGYGGRVRAFAHRELPASGPIRGVRGPRVPQSTDLRRRTAMPQAGGGSGGAAQAAFGSGAVAFVSRSRAAFATWSTQKRP